MYEKMMREGQLVDVEGCVSRWSMMASSASGFASSRDADKELRGTDNDIDFGQLGVSTTNDTPTLDIHALHLTSASM